MIKTSDELRENNRKVFPIKVLLDRFYGSNKRYCYFSGPNLNIPNNIDKNLSTEKFYELLTKHMKGEIRLGVSCELQRDENLILSTIIDIDYHEQSMEEKYELACKLQEAILTELGWKSVIEKSKSKGFHIFIFFNNPINRAFVQKQLSKIIEQDFGLKIKNGLIELFPKGDGVSVIFLPFFGMLDKDGFIQESFFQNKNNCLVKGNPFESIRDIVNTIENSINNVEHKKLEKEIETKQNLPCIEFAQNNWIEGNRQDLAMALSGVCRKKLNMSQDEAEDLILEIARNNSDNEISQRKGAIKSTYKIEDINHVQACSYFDRESICGECDCNKLLKQKDNIDSTNKGSKNISTLLKSSKDIMQEEDLKWVVKGLFSKKLVSIIFSEPGVGKTILAMDIAEKLTKGLPIFNTYKVERPMKVLYFQGDFPNPVMKDRLNKMMSQPDDNYFKIVNRYDAEEQGISIGLSSNEGQQNIKRIFNEYKPDFVIFDTFISFFDGDENMQKDVKGPIDFLRKITSEYDCSILLCHHSRKRGSNEKRKGLDQSDLIGSFVTARLCGLMLAIANDSEKSTKEEICNNVICAKTWFKPIDPFQFIIASNGDFYQVIYTTEEVTPSGKNKTQIAKERIVQLLTGMPDIQFPVKQLAQITCVSQRTLNMALSELLSAGTISATGTTKDRAYFYDSSKKVEKKKPSPKEFIDEENSLI